ncbi:MAG: lysostaphin resistance A-like protein [Christensenellaceae bacterium]
MLQEKNDKLPLDGQKSAGISYSVTMATILVMALFFSIISGLMGEDFLQSVAYNRFNYAIGGVAVAIAFCISLAVTETKISEVASFSMQRKYILPVLLIFFGMYFGLGNLNGWFSQLLEKLGYKLSVADESFFTPSNFVFLTVFVAIIPAIFEELVFRGIILRGLRSAGEIKAVLISSFAFSIYHLSPEKTLYQFLAGVVFSIIALRTDSIIFTVIMHFLNNFIVILNFCFFETEYTLAFTVISTVVGVLCLAVGGFLLLRNHRPFKGEKSTKNWWIYSIIGLLVAFSVWISNLVAR